MGSYKAYDSYVASNMSEEELLLAENVEALSSPGESGSNMVLVPTRTWYGYYSCYDFVDTGISRVNKWGLTEHLWSSKANDYHWRDCISIPSNGNHECDKPEDCTSGSKTAQSDEWKYYLDPRLVYNN